MASLTYRKILIISLGAYFWSKDLFAKFFLGGLYSGGFMHGRIFAFWKRHCCSSNCNVFRFSAHKLSLLLIFFTFVYHFVITVLQKTIGYQIQCSVFGIPHFSSKFNVMLELSYSKYNPRGLFLFIFIFFLGGGLIQWTSFSFQKLVPKRPGAYTRWGLLSEFYGMSLTTLL